VPNDTSSAEVIAEHDDLQPRERDTLNTLAAYFAWKFEYDPEAPRNGSTGRVRRALHSAGLSLDDKTIRKLLKAGAEKLARKE
jgi:hypothetical protein